MTTEEFSNEFDTLLNSHSTLSRFSVGESPSSIKLDEYEKSVFLTKAQEELVISLYNGKNSFGESFEKTEEIRRYLSDLVKTYSTSEQIDDQLGVSNDSIFYSLPDDLWFITYESVIFDDNSLGCMNHKSSLVVPITQDDYYKINRNPFKRPNKERVLRLDVNNNIVELVTKYNIDEYIVRYLTKPDPIILINLPNGLSINNKTVKTECKLNPALHRVILEKAVTLALMSKVPGAGVNKQDV